MYDTDNALKCRITMNFCKDCKTYVNGIEGGGSGSPAPGANAATAPATPAAAGAAPGAAGAAPGAPVPGAGSVGGSPAPLQGAGSTTPLPGGSTTNGATGYSPYDNSADTPGETAANQVLDDASGNFGDDSGYGTGDSYTSSY